jgi:hypothetical protein
MTSLSYSNFSTLRQCGEKYRLSVIEKVPTPPQVHFEFGSAMHAAINTSLETKDLEQAFDVFDAYWETCQAKLDFSGERFGPEVLQEMGRKFVGAFHKRLGSKMKLIVGEKRMYAEYAEQIYTAGFKSGKLSTRLEGTPDALVEWEGKNVLLDFKTSAYNYEREKTDISLQLHLYAWLLEQNGYKVDALAYIVFNKGAGSLQTPYIVQYKSSYALTLVQDMVHYYLRNMGHYEKNPNACIMGKQICPYFQRCHAKPEASTESEQEVPETESGLL